MTEIPFHLTPAGRVYHEVTLPTLVDELKRLNTAAADLVEMLSDLVDVIEHKRAAPYAPFYKPRRHGSRGASSLNPNP